MNRDPEGYGLDLGDQAIGVRAGVGLGEHDDRLGAALPGCREIALQPAQAEVAVERGDQKNEVDVGRHHLRAAAWSGSPADEHAGTRQQVMDGRRRLLRTYGARDPISSDRMVADQGFMEKLPRELGRNLALRSGEPVEPALLNNDAAGQQAARRMVGELALERLAPAVCV